MLEFSYLTLNERLVLVLHISCLAVDKLLNLICMGLKFSLKVKNLAVRLIKLECKLPSVASLPHQLYIGLCLQIVPFERNELLLKFFLLIISCNELLLHTLEYFFGLLVF